MKINWFIVGSVVVLAVILIIFLIKRNKKDEKNYSKYLKKNDASLVNKEELDYEDL